MKKIILFLILLYSPFILFGQVQRATSVSNQADVLVAIDSLGLIAPNADSMNVGGLITMGSGNGLRVADPRWVTDYYPTYYNNNYDSKLTFGKTNHDWKFAFSGSYFLDTEGYLAGGNSAKQSIVGEFFAGLFMDSLTFNEKFNALKLTLQFDHTDDLVFGGSFTGRALEINLASQASSGTSDPVPKIYGIYQDVWINPTSDFNVDNLYYNYSTYSNWGDIDVTNVYHYYANGSSFGTGADAPTGSHYLFYGTGDVPSYLGGDLTIAGDAEVGRGDTDTDITYIKLSSPDGTDYYIYPANGGGSLTISATKP